MFNNRGICLTIALTFLAACGQPGDDRKSRAENGLIPSTTLGENQGARASISERMVHYGVPGISVAVFDSGELVWAKGYGVETIDSGVSVDRNTLFQAASISKPVTAAGMLTLVQQGRVTLNEDVNDLLSDWQIQTNGFDAETPVTLEGLLNHSAGVTVHGFPGYQRQAILPSLDEILNGEEPANSPRIEVDIPVGSQWRYSGGGYTVVQRLVVETTEQSFSKFMEKSVLEPIGMTNSTFQQPLPAQQYRSVASGHQPGLGVVAGGHNVYPELAAAGLWTTATDLALFAINIHESLAGKATGVLDASTASEMFIVREGSHGLGFKQSGQEQSLRASHVGINHGFDSMLVMYPELGSGAVVMANSNLSQGLIDEILASIALAYSWPDYPILEQRRTRRFSEEQLDSYPGTYDLGDGSTVSVSRKDNRLFMIIPELGSTEIFSSDLEDSLFVTGIAFPSFKLVQEESDRTIQFVGP